jgi:hypothetical protein
MPKTISAKNLDTPHNALPRLAAHRLAGKMQRLESNQTEDHRC